MPSTEPADHEARPHPDESVGPLERGFAVLRALAAAPDGRLRASDLTKTTGLARSTVDRVAVTLGELGYVRAERDGHELVLAPSAAKLGNAYLRASGLPRLLTPLAEELSARLGESVSIAVPDRDRARFVVQIKRRRAVSVSFFVGDALPAERCAPGAIFAHTWAAAKDGWAQDDQLIEQGLIAIAVPVHGRYGDVVAALSVVSHTSRHTVESLREAVLAEMQATAGAMAAVLGAAAESTEAAGDDGERAVVDPTAEAKERYGPEYLQSLARGIRVLESLAEGGDRGLTLSAAAAAAGLPRATARRSLLTAVRQGYAASSDGNRFRVLPRVLELGYARLIRRSLGEFAQPHLEEAVRTVHESASMAVLDGDDIRYVARAAAGRIMSVDISIGTRFPAFATSMGRVLLADLDAARRAEFVADTDMRALTQHTITDAKKLSSVLDRVAAAGYALVDQELEEGLRSIAVPVRDSGGRAIAAVNVSMHAARTSVAEAETAVLPVLKAAAEQIAEDLALLSAAVLR